MKNLNKTRTRILIYLFLIFFSSFAIAASAPSDGLLDGVQGAFSKLQKPWFDVIRGYAFSLFWKLALLDMIWTSVTWVRDRKEVGEVMTSLANKILVIGFYYILLKMADTWIPQIIMSFTQIGQAAAGSGAANITPDAVLLFGLKISLSVFKQLIDLKMYEIMYMVMPLTLVAIIVLMAYGAIAGQLLITLIESYICIGAGVIMLGFGGSKWTSDMSTSYIKYAVGTGLKLMITYIVIGAGIGLFAEMNLMASSGTGNPFELMRAGLVIMTEAVIFGILSWQIPGIAAAITSGSPSLTLGGAIGTATAMIGAQMAANMAQQTVAGGQSLGSKGMDALNMQNPLNRQNLINPLNTGGSDRSNVDVPDPTGPAPSSNDGSMASSSNPKSGSGNAENASIGSSETNSNTKKVFDDWAKKNPSSKPNVLDKLKPQNDAAQIQVQGINLSHGKE